MKVKSSLSGPDGGQRNGRDYEQHRGQEAWGGEGRIDLCNHVDPWRLFYPSNQVWGRISL